MSTLSDICISQLAQDICEDLESFGRILDQLPSFLTQRIFEKTVEFRRIKEEKSFARDLSEAFSECIESSGEVTHEVECHECLNDFNESFEVHEIVSDFANEVKENLQKKRKNLSQDSDIGK